jgi:hypothetical protein
MKRIYWRLVAASAAIAVLLVAAHAAACCVPRTAPIGMAQTADLARMEQAGISSSLEAQAFGSPGLIGPYSQDTTVTSAVRPDMVIYTSYGTLSREIGSLPSSVTWVGLDLERWSLTPSWQQRNPARAEYLAEQVAHAHHKLLVNTPAVDLLSSMGHPQSQYWYLRTGLAASAARYGDAVVIQAQRWDANAGNYGWFVGKAAAQARAAHRGVHVMAGLSTCAGNVPVSASVLLAAYQATHVYGYWLNVPVWPACPTGNPQAAIGFLHQIYG